MVGKDYSMENPYGFSAIKLDKDSMISGQLVSVDESKPDIIKIETPVKATLIETELKCEETRVNLGFEPC